MKIHNIEPRFLSESYDEFKDAIAKFKKRFPKLDLHHGSRNRYETGQLLPFRLRGKPLDTPPIINYLINEHLKDDFGLPVRNLLYMSQLYDIADGYGIVYYIIPKGNNYRLFYADGTEDFSAEYGHPDTIETLTEIVFQNMEEDDYSREQTEHITNIINRDYGKYYVDMYAATSRKDMIAAFETLTFENDEEKELFKEFHERMVDEIKFYVERIYTDEYVVEEIKTSADVPFPEYEIMGYFPDGFYVIREEDTDDYF